jgi:formylglycine-generating enzyme required for sulfatase activity
MQIGSTRARVLAASFPLFALVPAASAVTIDWTSVGNPGNACEFQPVNTSGGATGCFGAVSYAYDIGTYEVTNAQYAEFLNAKATSDPLALYHTSMGSGFGGITRSGVSGNFTYSARAGRGDMPANFVSFYDALRFSNWLHNGQGGGDTETGAYTLLGGTATPSNGTTVTRNAGATVFVTSENEWYKAAYHNALGLSASDYFDYPAGFDAQTVCSTPTATANSANCNGAVGDLTTKGSYTGSASPHGTFDQGGNVYEWNETIGTGSARVIRGGSFGTGPGADAAAFRVDEFAFPSFELDYVGFRVAMIPEPGTGVLLMMGLLGLSRRRH